MSKQNTIPSQAEKKRLFFALWPGDDVLQKIKQHALPQFDRCNGRQLHAHNWHITLAYFGMADNETHACLEQQAQTLQAHPFSLELQLAGFWPRPRVAWLAPKEKPPELVKLAHDLQHALVPCGYTPESRAYQPHITLVRKAQQSPAVSEIESIQMQVGQFCLAESQTTESGAEYSILKRWDLTG